MDYIEAVRQSFVPDINCSKCSVIRCRQAAAIFLFGTSADVFLYFLVCLLSVCRRRFAILRYDCFSFIIVIIILFVCHYTSTSIHLLYRH